MRHEAGEWEDMVGDGSWGLMWAMLIQIFILQLTCGITLGKPFTRAYSIKSPFQQVL